MIKNKRLSAMNKPKDELVYVDKKGQRVELYSPTEMPEAGGFLWNKYMMVQFNCRGYAVGQFMQPEPSKYAYAPNLEAKTFMQPEHAYYANHPGRFFYIKDDDTGEVFSAPFEPTKTSLDYFCFSAGQNDIKWRIEALNIEVTIMVTLSDSDAIEMWELNVTNLDNKVRNISIYPYFTIGYMSWMNQSADFFPELNAIIATCISPYQKVEEYFARHNLKEKTFFIADTVPTSWCCNQKVFEGNSDVSFPDGIKAYALKQINSLYEVPAAVMQYQQCFQPEQRMNYRFLFGPASNDQQVSEIKNRYFGKTLCFDQEKNNYQHYVMQSSGPIKIDTGDNILDQFVNHWLPRQVFYLGDVNRLTTDPQTRNYLQDNLGMSYIAPNTARQAFITALSQQYQTGEMPDGILIHPDASLKYINQVPHTDHCLWLPICIQAYLNETNDLALLDQLVGFADNPNKQTVKQHIELALDWLIGARDERGLSYIAQGDWCDPMNMVGYKGRGVSTWLTLASAYAINTWIDICNDYQIEINSKYRAFAIQLNQAVNTHCWGGEWYSRGITDDNVSFGVADDKEGRIFLNPQSWAILSGAASTEQKGKLLAQIKQQLDTPFGTMMLAPSYTKMREDVGRVTQKFSGTAENGSIYNHAAIFYAYSLFKIGEGDKAFEVMRKMLPDDDFIQRGQLPTFIPNYYRGAYYQHPRTAGRSSQLFNTGTVSWFYRCVIECIAGLVGHKGDLLIKPQLPTHWPKLSVNRKFNGSIFEVEITKSKQVSQQTIQVNGSYITSNRITNIVAGKNYLVKVLIPAQSELIIIMGVSGCGKSTIAKQVSQQYNYKYIEADDFHSKDSIEMMAKGIPLTDVQRGPWIDKICACLQKEFMKDNGCVLAYSGLRAEHREKFRQLGFVTRFVFLDVDEKQISKRLKARNSHFFKADLLASQFVALQRPKGELDVYQIDANQPQASVLGQIVTHLKKGDA
ncbi:gluconokinase, GntK/IdnK-type [Thalassotalea psychrophila]|uniref:gluconokinase n=1 Tax=Thalassotalea psychrophila TaxID=3065647 RepID=A0ABY9TRY0_9GAMM|nr:gluconokinase, GntK/IdnK-type [Colwelliaceae bacterium SQ149]